MKKHSKRGAFLFDFYKSERKEHRLLVKKYGEAGAFRIFMHRMILK